MKLLFPLLALAALGACQSPVRSVHSWSPSGEGLPGPGVAAGLVVLPAHVFVGDRESGGGLVQDPARTQRAAALLDAELARALAERSMFEVLPPRSYGAGELEAIACCVERYQHSKGWSLLPEEDVEFGDAIAFVDVSGEELALLPIAVQWTPTSGREAVGWLTGAFMAHANTGATTVDLLLIEPRGGRLVWSGVYDQSATAGWKTAALTEEEHVAEILRDILDELPDLPGQRAVARG